METLPIKIANLAIAQVTFTNKDIEASFERSLSSFGHLYELALEIQDAAANDAQVEQVADGVLKLASEFGMAFGHLSDEQKQRIEDAMTLVITGDNEGLVESFFNAALDCINDFQQLNMDVDAALAPQNPPTE